MKESGQPNTDQHDLRIGIFWLIGQRLVIDTITLSEADNYAEFKIYGGDHFTLWSKLEKQGQVPRGTPYELYPRGRSNYNSKTQRFSLFADACILRKANVMARLMRLMRLPSDTAISTDEHYRCFRCLAGNSRLPKALSRAIP